jgi:hypothetical protein
MILVGAVVRLEFGKAKKAKALMKEGMRRAQTAGSAPTRQLSERPGPLSTVVLESAYENLASRESSMGTEMATDEMAVRYERFKPLVDSGYREIFTVIDGT